MSNAESILHKSPPVRKREASLLKSNKPAHPRTSIRDCSQSTKPNTIRLARAEALHEDLRERGNLVLHDSTFRLFKGEGWSRSELMQAANDLATDGVAVIERFGVVLEVKLVSKESVK